MYMSTELDYAILLSGSAGSAGPAGAARAAAHVVGVARPDNVALLSKLLRSLPPALRPPLPAAALYAHWLTNHFFSVSTIPLYSLRRYTFTVRLHYFKGSITMDSVHIH
ncbi:hypothetical protein HF086_006601 [Spodoptera exigua]|uniref:Uncharacterized protein n=1 Tax=Spodoptera exigua TaxID=7107 RepID=A0A922SBY8_SPOEX|nr:hypothetical protein HF086_006601 [Spodoptera exigua]